MGQRILESDMIYNFISKYILGVITLVAVNCTLNGQEVEIFGKISDGSQAPPAPPKIPPRLQTIQSVVHSDQNRSVVLRRVVDPGYPTPISQAPVVRSDNDLQLVISPELAREIEMRKQTVNFSVSVTVIDHQVSFLRWKHEDQQYEAWSNIDFNHLLGFGEFRVGEKIYSPWFGVGNVNYSANEIRDWLGSPPIFANAAYSYVVTKGNANNLEAVEGIEALHKLYRHKTLELKSAYEARERVRKENTSCF